MNGKSLFITFEGGEGAGKTTLIEGIAKYLEAKGYEVVTAREPGGTPLGEHIRQWLLNRDFTVPVGRNAELLLFLTSRVELLETVILPALQQGKAVLCDRFNDSTIVYQGIARGLGKPYVERLCHLVTQGLNPLITFYLDIDPELGLERSMRVHKEIAAAGKLDRIESEALEFHKTVRQGFLELAKENTARIALLNAAESQSRVLNQAKALLDQKL